MRRLFPIFSLVLCVLALLSSCTDKNASAVIQDKQNYTIRDQRVIGEHLAETIKSDPQQFDVLNANAYGDAYQYLEKMLRSAVITEQVVLREEFEWEIIPLVDDQNAFAYSMPGGKVVISTGMLRFIEFESELLALLSNEIYYTDIDLHTASIRDEFSGIRLGSIALGNDDDSADIIEFLEKQRFSEADVLQADLRTVSVMCPFNYDINSLKSFVDRSKAGVEMDEWMNRRPRPDNWNELYLQEMNRCNSNSSERFKSRYEAFKTNLP